MVEQGGADGRQAHQTLKWVGAVWHAGRQEAGVTGAGGRAGGRAGSRQAGTHSALCCLQGREAEGKGAGRSAPHSVRQLAGVAHTSRLKVGGAFSAPCTAASAASRLVTPCALASSTRLRIAPSSFSAATQHASRAMRHKSTPTAGNPLQKSAAGAASHSSWQPNQSICCATTAGTPAA